MDALSSTFLTSNFTQLRPQPPTLSPPPPVTTVYSVSTQHRPTRITTTTETAQQQDKKTATNTIDRITSPAPSAPSLPASLCNALDGLINNFIDPPLYRPSVNPRHVLSDNFAPVAELPPTPCKLLRGRIPGCLFGGAYIRNGPNPQHLPRGPYHLFDGDGMLHTLLLSSPAPTLSSRHVRTYRYTLERRAGAPVLPNVFSAFHGRAGIARAAVTALRVLTAQMDPLQGIGLANTSLSYFGRRLYALGESDLPYSIHVSPTTGDAATISRSDFNGSLSIGMTAHPKKDPSTGELFAFRYGPVPPYLTYFRFDADGNRSGPEVPIFSMKDPSFLHDFAITQHYALFPDIQMVMNPVEMVVGNGSPVGSNNAKVPRIGVLPRYAANESGMRWYEVPGFNPMHAINAWEEDGGDTIVVIAPNVLSIEHALDRLELVHSSVEMLRIELSSGAVSRTPLSAGNMDFGVINPGYTGRKNRYAYLGIGDPMPKISGVAKLDFELAGRGDCIVARREFGPGCFGGEPFFVAAGENGDEDDGYLVSYVHDEGRGESRFVVMDARSPDLDLVAEVLLPRRVPYGFHGLFVTEAELRAQI